MENRTHAINLNVKSTIIQIFQVSSKKGKFLPIGQILQV